MKKIFVLLWGVILLSGSADVVQAALYDRGGGIIYDSDLNISWLQDADYAKTSGYDSDGKMNWNAAVAWADGLVYGGYSDWRLPKIGVALSGYHDDSELGHLFHVTLGNGWGSAFTSTGPFVNVKSALFSTWYWFGTERADLTAYAWFFYTGGSGGGTQGVDSKSYALYAWAVRDGDVLTPPPPPPPSVPIPATAWLLVSGLSGLIALKKRIGRHSFNLLGEKRNHA